MNIPLQKHHSFCYFQPIHSVKESDPKTTNEDSLGPLIYKPNKNSNLTESSENLSNRFNHNVENNREQQQNTRKDSFRELRASEYRLESEIDPAHRDTMNKLHDLLTRESPARSNSINLSKNTKQSTPTYTLASLNKHKYVPKSDEPNLKPLVAQKRLVYADLDLEDHNKKYNDKVNSNRQLFSKDASNRLTNKSVDTNRQRTPYATLKFDDVDI